MEGRKKTKSFHMVIMVFLLSKGCILPCAHAQNKIRKLEFALTQSEENIN